MTKTTDFTPRQEEILKGLLNMTADRWRVTVMGQSRETEQVDRLEQILAETTTNLEFLLDLRAELPSEHHLHGYFDISRWTQAGETIKHSLAHVGDRKAGIFRHLDLPGDDVEEMVRGLYANLNEMIKIGPELIEYVRSRINNGPLFSGKEDQAPYAEIIALPAIVTREQRTGLAEDLVTGQGTIDLTCLSKGDAAIVVTVLNQRLRRRSADLTTAQRAQVLIKYNSGEFGWYSKGTRGGRAQDQAAHITRSHNVKAFPSIAAWRSSLPE